MSFLTRLLRGLRGLVVLVGIAYALSTDRKSINWRVVGTGIGLQFIFALMVLKTSWGKAVFETIGAGFAGLLNFTYQGSEFIFGPLAIPAGTQGFVRVVAAAPSSQGSPRLSGEDSYPRNINRLTTAEGASGCRTRTGP